MNSTTVAIRSISDDGPCPLDTRGLDRLGTYITYLPDQVQISPVPTALYAVTRAPFLPMFKIPKLVGATYLSRLIEV